MWTVANLIEEVSDFVRLRRRRCWKVVGDADHVSSRSGLTAGSLPIEDTDLIDEDRFGIQSFWEVSASELPLALLAPMRTYVRAMLPQPSSKP